MEKFKRIERKVIREGNIIDICVDKIVTPDNQVRNFDFISHKGAAAVVPVTDDGQIIMVRQWRDAIDRFTLEIPAGGLLSPDEPTFDCAVRELAEETGYRSENVEFLKSIYTTVAFCNEKIDIYVARNLVPGDRNLDPDEYINVEKYSVEELLGKVFADEIQDAKTAAAILAYYLKYCGDVSKK